MGEFRVFPPVTGRKWTCGSISLGKTVIYLTYFAHKRMVFNRRGVWLAGKDFVNRMEDEELVTNGSIPFIGTTCTGRCFQRLTTWIYQEVMPVKQRGTRHDDKRSETYGDKRQGYF